MFMITLAACSASNVQNDNRMRGSADYSNDGQQSEFEARLPPPEAYVGSDDRERARQFNGNEPPCSFVSSEYGSEVIASLPTDQCYRMHPQQQYRGL